MKRLAFALAFLMAATPAAYAHPDHDLVPEVNPRDLAVTSAQYAVETMIGRNVLDASWRGVEPSAANLRQRQGAYEWVVTFRNPSVTDPSHQVLYVMVTQTGEYIAANYTGN